MYRAAFGVPRSPASATTSTAIPASTQLRVGQIKKLHLTKLEGALTASYSPTSRYVKARPGAGIRGGAANNTHVFAHAGRLFTFVEVALPTEIDRHLETVGPVDFGGVDTAFTAHGKVDPDTGELLAF